MEAVIVEINAWAWGVPMQVLLLGTGMFFDSGVGFPPLEAFGIRVSIAARGLQGRG